MSDRLWAKSWDEKGEPPESVYLDQHLRDVYQGALSVLNATGTEQLRAVGLSPDIWESRLRRVVLVAAALHDLGKANNHFQDMIAKCRVRKPQGMRHEWVMYWLAQQSPWKEWGPKVIGDELDWRIAMWGITGHHPAYGRSSPPKDKPSKCTDLEMKLLITHQGFRSCVDWIEDTFGGGLLPTGIADADKTLKLVGLTGTVFHVLKKSVGDDRDRWNELDEATKRFVAIVKACLLAADVAGSYAGECSGQQTTARANGTTSGSTAIDNGEAVIKRETLGSEVHIEQLAEGLAHCPQPDELEGLVRERLGEQTEYPFQTDVADKENRQRVTFVKAGCGSGKTAAAYLWAARCWPGRRLYFCYPTTGTATEGFKDYLFDEYAGRSKYGAQLFHSRAEVDADLILNVDQEREADEQSDPNESWLRADSMSAWSTPIVCCTMDRVMGLMQNQRKGLMCWPALAQSAFVFDEIHAYDNKLFGLMLRFLQECPGLPVLLMTASLPDARKKALLDALRHKQPEHSDDCLLREVPGPAVLEELKRYHRIEPDSVEERVRDEIAAGGRVLWVCNTVDRAMDAAKLIGNLNPLIYHSRFKYRDRVAQHIRVIDAFKPDSLGGVVAISTQVAEMSLDLKAVTLLVTDLCPVPSFIQRLGRLNRAATPPKAGESPPPTCPFCVIEPMKDGKFYSAPYGTDEDEYGDWPTQTLAWLKELGNRELSQDDLAKAWKSNSIGDVRPADCCWLDGGPITLVDAVRESSPGVTVIMPADAAVVLQRKKRLAMLRKAMKEHGRIPKRNAKPWQQFLMELSLPMPQPHGHWQDSRPINGIRQVREGVIEYEPLRGAKWMID